MKKLSYLMMTVILCIGLVSCGKDGSMGPQGPMGEQGEQGAAGKDGTAVLNGSADPTADQGKVGDFYINTSSYVLFGPKTNAGWGNGESILGATGAKGEKGDKGDKGDTGATGAKGEKGDKGDKGDTGATGAKGEKGDKGDKGDTGATGAKGDKGDKGEKGDKGDKGEADYVILSGTSDPTNSIGAQGDFYINLTAKTFFYRGPTITGRPAWVLVSKLANTMQFTKTEFSLSSITPDVVIDLPYSVLLKSMVHVYVDQSSTLTTPLPGYVGSGTTLTYYRYRLNSMEAGQKTRLIFERVSGNASFGALTIRIVVTEAHEFHTISKHVDFNNYHEVSQYFGLKH